MVASGATEPSGLLCGNRPSGTHGPTTAAGGSRLPRRPCPNPQSLAEPQPRAVLRPLATLCVLGAGGADPGRSRGPGPPPAPHHPAGAAAACRQHRLGVRAACVRLWLARGAASAASADQGALANQRGATDGAAVPDGGARAPWLLRACAPYAPIRNAVWAQALRAMTAGGTPPHPKPLSLQLPGGEEPLMRCKPYNVSPLQASPQRQCQHRPCVQPPNLAASGWPACRAASVDCCRPANSPITSSNVRAALSPCRCSRCSCWPRLRMPSRPPSSTNCGRPCPTALRWAPRSPDRPPCSQMLARGQGL